MTSVQIVEQHGILDVIGMTIELNPVADNVTEVDVVAVITKVSNDLNIVVYSLYTLFCNFIFGFCLYKKRTFLHYH